MKNKILKILGAVTLLAIGSSAHAASCVGLVINNAGTSTLTQCEFGGLTFDDWELSVVPTAPTFYAQVGVGSGSAVVGDSVNINFQVNTLPSPVDFPADITLRYSVGPGIAGVDIGLGTFGIEGVAGVTITELVCASAFVNGTCAAEDIIATLIVNDGDTYKEVLFDQVYERVWISKDIQLNAFAGSVSLSDFVNSHEVVPEPASLGLLGLGLLGIGAMRRRRGKAA